MRTHLTHRIFRQLATGALYIDLRCCATPLSRRCLYQPHETVRIPPSHVTRRTLFLFSRESKRKPKTANFEPGYEVLLELDERLKTGVRPPPLGEVSKALKRYLRHKESKGIWLNETQLEYMRTAYLYLRDEDAEACGLGLSLEEKGIMFEILRLTPPLGCQSHSHVALSKLLFMESENSKIQADSEGQQSQRRASDFRNDLVSHIEVLSQHGAAIDARDLVGKYWISTLKDGDHDTWLTVMRGFIKMDQRAEVEKTVAIMRGYGVPLDEKLRYRIMMVYAQGKEDVAMTKHWFCHSVQDSQLPSNDAIVAVLELCIRKGEFDWGDTIFKTLLKRSPDDKPSWDMIFRWSAARGRGVDEIERMMKVNVRRNKDRPALHPDIATINSLAELANSKNDPYTAERYISLGQKWGFQPNVTTYLLQLDYRIKVNDLAGAMVAYGALRREDLSNLDDTPYVNRLICAFCELRSQNYDTIMSLVEDLTERKAPFLPQTVAALSRLHLQRNEMDDLADLLNTHAFHFGLTDRELVRSVLLDHILNPSTSELRAWETYAILNRIFQETTTEPRVEVMQSFFTRNRPDLATHVFRHMRKAELKSQRPTVEIYAACLEGIGKGGDIESLESVHNMVKLDNEIEPNTKLYNALMLAYAGCGEPRRALGFWEDIVHSREGPTYGSIHIAFKVCEKAPFGERVARDIWSQLKKFGIEVTREIYAAYVGALAGQGLYDECVRLIEGVENEGLKVDALM